MFLERSMSKAAEKLATKIKEISLLP